MVRSRFSEEQIIAILEEQEAGMATADVCRRHGISSATFYKWKSKYGGLDVSEARRLRTLEEENSWLKKLLAEAMLDNAECAVAFWEAQRVSKLRTKAANFMAPSRVTSNASTFESASASASLTAASTALNVVARR